MVAPELPSKTRIIVDTDVFSFIFKKHPNAEWFKPYLMNKTLALSFMSVGELYYGAYKDNWGQAKIEELENTIKNYVILPYSYSVCQQWARIRKKLEEHGIGASHADLWIAACAIHYDCALATNNGQHFNNIENLTVICPTLFSR